MSSTLFELHDDKFLPTGLSRGPWSPHALHGGPPAALIARAIERHEPSNLFVARLTVELTRPVPLEPLTLSVRTTRPGKKVQLLEASLRTEAHEVARATALKIRQTDVPLPADVPHDTASVLPPEQGAAVEGFGHYHEGFHSHATEHRFVKGAFLTLGGATDWIRLKYPVLEGEDPSPLCRVMAAADFGNGISAVLGPSYTFLNPDLTVYLHRYPRGEWVCLDARTRVEPNGVGMAESRLFDRDGPIGRAVQSLIVEAR